MDVAVVSSRSSVRLRLANAVRTAGAHAVRECGALSSVLIGDALYALVIIDLGDPGLEVDSVDTLGVWRRVHPTGHVLTYVDTPRSMTLYRAFARFAGAELLCPDDLDGQFLVMQVAEAAQGLAHLHQGIKQAFCEAVAATGRTLRSDTHVLHFLELAPQNPNVGALADKTVDAPTATARKAKLTRTLRANGTLNASDLLVLMKILWWVYLREHGWKVDDIAAFLHTTPKNFRKQANDRMQLTQYVLKRLPWSVVSAWVAELCVEPYTTPPGPQQLVTTLVQVTERVRGRINVGAADLLQRLFRAQVSTRPTPRNARCLK